MAQRVLIAPDKFKGTLSASDAAEAIARGWKAARPKDELTLLPMSDGGDGFGEVMGRAVGAKKQIVETVDAAHQPIEAAWWWDAKTHTAIVEAALVNGLAMLPHRKFHPFQLDTFGLARVLQSVARAGAKECIVGIGGSATNDAGFGLARALGWKFLAADSCPTCAPTRQLDEWWQLGMLARIEKPTFTLPLKITVAVDVKNPLLGPRGCTRVYGPQKGLDDADFALAENALGQLAKVYKRQFGRDLAKAPGSGAAGGLGFGLMAFTNAKLANGFELFAKHANLREYIRNADLVLTGEGAIDRQTFMGKGVGQLAKLCKKNRVPCIAFGGIADVSQKQKLFSEVRALTEITTSEKAKKNAARYLAALAKKIGAQS
ncbi:MAG: glycerate kinase family protein [Limisphaerales bacterium]